MLRAVYLIFTIICLVVSRCLWAQDSPQDIVIAVYSDSNASFAKIFNYKKDNITDSLFNVFKLAAIKHKFEDQADLLYSLGNHFLDKGNFTPAILAFEQALKQSEKSKIYPTIKELNTIVNLVNAYASNNQYDRATEVSVLGLNLANTKLPKDIADSLKIYLYINMSLIFVEINQDDRAQYYLDQAEQLASQKNHFPFTVNILNSKGVLADNKKDWKKSRYYYKEILQIADSLKNDEYRSIALGNFGISHYRSGELEEAKSIFKKLIEDDSGLPFHKRNEAYKMVGEILFQQKKYIESIPYFEQSLQNATKQNSSQDLVHAHRHLSMIYEQTGNLKAALMHSRATNLLIDSLAKSESTDKINQLEILHRSAENEKTIRENEFKIEQQQSAIRSKNLMLVGISILIILLSLLFFALLKIIRDRQKRRIKSITHQQQLFAQEQEMLQLKTAIEAEQQERSRIARELHDGIGGMLSAIAMNIGAASKKNTVESVTLVEQMLRDVAQEVRNTAHNLMPNALLQKSFAEALLQYKNSINAGQEHQLHLEIYGTIDWIRNDAKLILYRIIQELIQNALKHSQAKDMYLQIIEHSDSIQITFEDNGIGFDTSEVSKGLGIVNIESRVQSLHGECSIQSIANKGTSVFLDFAKEQLN